MKNNQPKKRSAEGEESCSAVGKMHMLSEDHDREENKTSIAAIDLTETSNDSSIIEVWSSCAPEENQGTSESSFATFMSSSSCSSSRTNSAAGENRSLFAATMPQSLPRKHPAPSTMQKHVQNNRKKT